VAEKNGRPGLAPFVKVVGCMKPVDSISPYGSSDIAESVAVDPQVTGVRGIDTDVETSELAVRDLNVRASFDLYRCWHVVRLQASFE